MASASVLKTLNNGEESVGMFSPTFLFFDSLRPNGFSALQYEYLLENVQYEFLRMQQDELCLRLPCLAGRVRIILLVL